MKTQEQCNKEQTMQYILKNKDEVVLEFEVEKESEIFEGQTISHFSLKNAFVINPRVMFGGNETDIDYLEEILPLFKVGKIFFLVFCLNHSSIFSNKSKFSIF